MFLPCTLLILICLILPFYSHVTNMHLTSFIEMHFWSPKIQTDSVPSVFSLLLNPLRCGRNLSHTYCNLWHCQHESPGPVVLGKLSLPYLLFCLCLSTHPVAARRRQPQRTRQQFLRDNTVLSFFLQHQISREAAGVCSETSPSSFQPLAASQSFCIRSISFHFPHSICPFLPSGKQRYLNAKSHWESSA